MSSVGNGPGSLQTDTLCLYTALMSIRPDWPGSLLVSCGLGQPGSAVALAANVAGAACLSIEADPAVCRTAMRLGACDFLVNTVDEALRVLKNEIRQRRPLSVALELDLSCALEELLERGVLPQLFTATGDVDTYAISRFIQGLEPYGMGVLDLSETVARFPSSLERQVLTLHAPIFETGAALKAFDARLQQLISAADPRHRWLVAAPRLFHRDRPYRRAVLLMAEELSALTE